MANRRDPTGGEMDDYMEGREYSVQPGAQGRAGDTGQVPPGPALE